MPLTDLECKKVICPPDRKRLRVADSNGLYLEVSPRGSKRWMWKYRFANVEKLMALGAYPKVGLKEARNGRDAAKLLRAKGIDPMALRKQEKLKVGSVMGDSFEEIARDWWKRQQPRWSEGHAVRTESQLKRDLFKSLGARRMQDITAPELLAVLRKVEARGALETADRALTLARQVWRYGVSAGKVDKDITTDLKGALTPYRAKHFAAITDPKQLGELLRSIQGYKGSTVVRAALQLAPMLFQRPGELRGAEWSEVDLDDALWTIPPARMKRGKEGKEYGDVHYVPLPTQAVQILRELKKETGNGRFVFPGQRSHDRGMSDNSVRSALINMGYTPDKHTWHGFRATARTMLAERLDCDPLLIEAQLAHSVKDANGRAYNRTQYLFKRKEMMQKWADYLDELTARKKTPTS